MKSSHSLNVSQLTKKFIILVLCIYCFINLQAQTSFKVTSTHLSVGPWNVVQATNKDLLGTWIAGSQATGFSDRVVARFTNKGIFKTSVLYHNVFDVAPTIDNGYILTSVALDKSAIISKYDSTAKLVWQKKIKSSVDNNFEYCKVKLSKQGNIYLAVCNQADDHATMKIIKLTQDGNIIWNKAFKYYYSYSFFIVQLTPAEDDGLLVYYSEAVSAGYGTEPSLQRFNANGDIVTSGHITTNYLTYYEPIFATCGNTINTVFNSNLGDHIDYFWSYNPTTGASKAYLLDNTDPLSLKDLAIKLKLPIADKSLSTYNENDVVCYVHNDLSVTKIGCDTSNVFMSEKISFIEKYTTDNKLCGTKKVVPANSLTPYDKVVYHEFAYAPVAETIAITNVTRTISAEPFTEYTLDCSNAVQSTQNNFEATSITKVSVYPNPVANIFTVTGLQRNQQSAIKLLSSNGNILLTATTNSNSYTHNIQNLTAGIYYLQIIQNNKSQMMKFIKE